MSPYEEQLEIIKKSIIGDTIEEAVTKAKRTGWSIRIKKQNGKSCVGTCDYRSDRINVVVDNDKITEIVGFG